MLPVTYCVCIIRSEVCQDVSSQVVCLYISEISQLECLQLGIRFVFLRVQSVRMSARMSMVRYYICIFQSTVSQDISCIFQNAVSSDDSSQVIHLNISEYSPLGCLQSDTTFVYFRMQLARMSMVRYYICIFQSSVSQDVSSHFLHLYISQCSRLRCLQSDSAFVHIRVRKFLMFHIEGNWHNYLYNKMSRCNAR